MDHSQTIIEFNKYVKFLSEQFNISVEFEGASKNSYKTNNSNFTDKTKIIRIPNLEVLTVDEIDALYGLLLNEVGHLSYSEKSAKKYASLITEAAALLANGLENARVENKLLKKFDGANAVLGKLYNDCATNPELNKKFYADKSETAALSHYLHNKLYKGSVVASLADMVGHKVASKIISWANYNNIDSLLENSNLKSFDDVIFLTKKIHMMYFKSKDTSPLIKIDKQENILLEVHSSLNSIPKQLESYTKKIEALEEKNRQKRKEIRDKITANKTLLATFVSQKQKNKEQLDQLETALNYLKSDSVPHEQLHRQSSLQNKVSNELQDTKDRLDNIKNRLSTKLNQPNFDQPQNQNNTNVDTNPAPEILTQDQSTKSPKELEEQYNSSLENYDALKDAISNLNSSIESRSQLEKLKNQENRNENLKKSSNEKLEAINDKLDKFKKDHNILPNDSVPEDLVGAIDNLNQKLSELKDKSNDYQNKIDNIKSQKAEEQNNLNDLGNNPVSDFMSNKLPDIIDKLNNDKKDLVNNLKNLSDAVKSGDESTQTKTELSQLTSALKILESVLSDMESASSNFNEKLNANHNQSPTVEEITAVSQDLMDSLNNVKPDLKSQIKDNLSELNKNGTPQTPEQKKKLEEKLQRLENKIDELNQKLSQKTDKVNDAKDTLAQLQKDFESIDESMKTTPTEGLEQLQKQISDETNKIDEGIHKINSDTHKEKQELNTMQSEINKIEGEKNKSLMESLASMQEQLNKSGIKVQLIPQFIENPGWEKADDAQKKFDKSAGAELSKMVVNGAGINLGNKDLVQYIEDKKTEVESINVVDIFQKNAKLSQLESLRSGQESETNHLVDANSNKTYHSVKRHIPATIEFDEVKTENTCLDPVKSKLFRDLKSAIIDDTNKVKNAMRQKFKFSKKDKFKGGREEGELDSRNLYKLATNLDNNYYEVNEPKFVNKIAASIFVDISGSLDKDFTANGKKLVELSYILSEGLKESHIPHEICGYCAPVSQELRDTEYTSFYNRRSNKLLTTIYKKFEDKTNLGLANLELQCSDNADGESIRIAMTRLKKRNSKTKMLFILTDGKPFLSDSDVPTLDEDLRTALRELVRNKIEVFAFGFNDMPSEFYGSRYLKINKYSDIIKFIDKIDLNRKNNNSFLSVTKMKV